jgi:hypothetical protein
MHSPLTILTSLSPNPARRERQLFCMRSWENLGARIDCMQTREEVRSLDGTFPDVHCWHQLLGKQQVLIEDLLACMVRIGKCTLLLNSDIELLPSMAALPILADKVGDGLLYLVRTNHDPDGGNRSRETGIDGFFFSPDTVEPFGGTLFAIGQPWWDYVLPYSYLARGRKLFTIGDELVLHERHVTRGWSVETWEQLAPTALSILGMPGVHSDMYQPIVNSMQRRFQDETTMLQLGTP